MLSGETAANALLEMAKGLKEMRDGKLLSLLQEEAKEAGEREEGKTHTVEELESKLRELQQQIAEQEQRPEAIPEEKAEEIRAAARREAEEQAKQRQAEAIKAAREEQEKKAAKDLEKSLCREREKLRREYQESLSTLSEDREQYKAQLERLKKEQQVSGDNPEVLKFTFYYEQLKTAVKNMLETAEKLRETEPQTAQKLEGGLRKYLSVVSGRLEDASETE